MSLAVAGDKPACLHWLQQSVDSGYDVGQFIKALNHYIRKMMLVGLSPDLARFVKADIAEEDFKILEGHAGRVSPLELARWLKTFSEAKQNLEHYPLPQMAVEMAIINLLFGKENLNNQPTLSHNLPPKISNDQFPISKQTPISNDQNKKPSAVSCPLSANEELLDSVLAKWNDIVAEVRPHNHSLFGFLQGMKIKGATATSLVLSTKYSFHRERMTDTKNKKIIEEAVQKVLGRRLALICELEK